MPQEQFFSVVIPLYNKEHDVARTLKTVLYQEYKNFEVIIINDGSTDDSEKVVRKFQDDRIRIVTTENRGLSAARNLGVKKALYDYIAFIDADDFWYKDHLAEMRKLILNYPSQSWYSTSYDVLLRKDYKVPSVWFRYMKQGWHGVLDDFFIRNRTQWLVNICTICVTRKMFTEIGGFDESITCEEDIDFYIRLALKVPIVYLNSITMSVNMLGSNRISDSNFKGKSFIDLRKYKSYEDKMEDFKKFLDFFRYTQYVKFTLTSNYSEAYQAKAGISVSNLTFVQRVIINMPRFVLSIAMKIKAFLLLMSWNTQISKPNTK